MDIAVANTIASLCYTLLTDTPVSANATIVAAAIPRRTPARPSLWRDGRGGGGEPTRR
jgi:hypothetical protein